MQRILIVTSACAVLIATGVVHGVWTDRWSDQSDLAEVAARLDRLPMVIGPWHGTTVDMENNQNSSLAGMIVRRYVHAETGKAVTLLVACGRAGAVCTHTPDVCYAGSGFDVEKPNRFVLQSAGSAAPEFWTARFVRERASGKTNLRIFWSWRGADSWKVAENPRLAFAGERVMHKIYVIREMITADEPIDSDPCVEFMGEALPALDRCVLVESR